MKMRGNQKGFSLVELIIVVAIMAVLIGVLAPQYLKYVEQSKRVADVHMADEMANQIAILASYYGGFSYDVHEETGIPYEIVSFQREMMMTQDFPGKTETEIIELLAEPNANGVYNLGGLLFTHFGTIPVSQTNPDYGWYIAYDAYTAEVLFIMLMDFNEDWTALENTYQVWPEADAEAFLNGY